jgi:hypothetical protein
MTRVAPCRGNAKVGSGEGGRRAEKVTGVNTETTHSPMWLACGILSELRLRSQPSSTCLLSTFIATLQYIRAHSTVHSQMTLHLDM